MDAQPDGTRKICFTDRVLTVCDRNGLDVIATCEFDEAVQHSSLAYKGSRLAIGDRTNCRVIDVTNGTCIGEFNGSRANLVRIQLSVDGQRLMTWRAGELPSVWDVDEHRQLLGNGSDWATCDYAIQSNGKELREVSMSSDGKQLIQRVQELPTTQVYRVDGGALVTQTDVQFGVASPNALSAHTSRFLVGNSDTRARVWDAALGQPVGPCCSIRLSCDWVA